MLPRCHEIFNESLSEIFNESLSENFREILMLAKLISLTFRWLYLRAELASLTDDGVEIAQREQDALELRLTSTHLERVLHNDDDNGNYNSYYWRNNNDKYRCFWKQKSDETQSQK